MSRNLFGDLLIERLSDGQWSWDSLTNQLSFSRDFGAPQGYTAEELPKTADALRSYVHPDDLQLLLETVEPCLHGKAQGFQVATRVHCKDGTWRWFLYRGSVPEAKPGSRPEVIQGIQIGIQECHGPNDALKESERKFRDLLQELPGGFTLGMAVTNARDKIVDFRIQEINPSCEKLINLPREKAIGQSFSSVFSSDQEDFMEICATVAETGIPQSLELFIRAWGKFLDFRLYRPQPRFIAIFFFDVTTRKIAEAEKHKLEAQIQHSQKLESLGVLAGGIAHDFNNLLTSILGNADLAMSDLSPKAPTREFLKQIITASKRASDLTRQMLAYSGRGRFIVEPAHLREIVEEMTHLLEVSISKKVSLQFNFAEQIPPVEADSTQIRQVIMNLITNASESIGDQPGVISLTTGVMHCADHYFRDSNPPDTLPTGQYCYFEVSDTGCGMTKEVQAKIFDPFFTTKFTGRGLGMAAVLGIVRSHHGSIKIYSEPGKGASFKVLLPALSQGHQVTKDQAITPSWKSSGTVLLVDDEAVLAIGRLMLERIGFNVLTAMDGVEALRIYRKHLEAILLTILDLTMPKMDGEETFHEIRCLKKDARVFISSGYNETDVGRRFIGKGLAGFIPKPYQLSTLINVLRQALPPEPAEQTPKAHYSK